MIGWGKNRAAQQPTGIGPQQFEKDHLGGCGCGRVSHTSPAKSSRVSDIDPIRRPIHRPAMTLRVDKGFQQHHAVPERFFPIPRQTPLTERENARPQIEQVPVGKNEKAAIVDHQLQAGILMAEAPTDPAIACGALQCRGRKAQQCDPLLPPARHVPKRFSNLGQMAQVVMLSHELLVAGLFAEMNEPHHHLAQFRTRSRVIALGTHSRARIQGQDRDVQKNL